MTLAEWLARTERRLRAHGIEAARLEAQLLAGHVLRVDRSWLFAHPEHDFPDLAGESILQRREGGEPLAYILGSREFFGRDFRVTPSVLIPRHETETLVEAALELAPSGALQVLDVGVGSGAIAVTLKLERPDWHVTGVDLSPEALIVAADNADALGAKVRLVHSDLVSEVTGEAFDLIVSNPPYIGHTEPLLREVADFEPHLALYGGESGLEVYQRLASEAPTVLADGGLLMVEVGYRQAALVQELFEAAGWTHVETRRDLTGVDRVVVVRYAWDCQLPGNRPESLS